MTRIITAPDGDEIHLDGSQEGARVELRLGPQSGDLGKGSRTCWITPRQAKALAFHLLAFVEEGPPTEQA